MQVRKHSPNAIGDVVSGTEAGKNNCFDDELFFYVKFGILIQNIRAFGILNLRASRNSNIGFVYTFLGQ